MKARRLVTGATGKTGAAPVRALRTKDWPVGAMVHPLDARSAILIDVDRHHGKAAEPSLCSRDERWLAEHGGSRSLDTLVAP